jgi:hypothetical protein
MSTTRARRLRGQSCQVLRRHSVKLEATALQQSAGSRPVGMVDDQTT